MRFYQAQYPSTDNFPEFGELRSSVELAKQDLLNLGYSIEDLTEKNGVWYSPAAGIGISLTII